MFKWLIRKQVLFLLGCACWFAGTQTWAQTRVLNNNNGIALLEAIQQGGDIVLNFSSTYIYDPILITKDTVLRAASTLSGPVTISGQNALNIFTVNPGVRFGMERIALVDATNSAGGGALSINQGQVYMTNCIVSNSFSGLNGGAILAVSSDLFMTNCILQQTAAQDGGGIYMDKGKLIALGCQFNGGLGTNRGGAIFLGQAWAALTNCTFSTNNAIGADGTNGLAGASQNGVGKNGGNGETGQDAFGGAIWNDGPLSLDNCQFQQNSALAGDGGDGGAGGAGSYQGGDGGFGGYGGIAKGGAIFNEATGVLKMSNCLFASNRSVGGVGGSGGTKGNGAFTSYSGRGGAGGGSMGGGVFNLGSLVFSGCNFNGGGVTAGNSVGGGTDRKTSFGFDGQDGTLGQGGAVCNLGNLIMINSTICSNTVTAGNAGNGGDGSWKGGNGGDGGHGFGGGIYNHASLAITNCTLVGNGVAAGLQGTNGAGLSSASGGASGTANGGNLASDNGLCIIKNTIIANSTAGTNFFGSLLDAGNNLSSDYSCAFTSANSYSGLAPRLGTLGNYGGNTPAIPLLVRSPAIGKGDPWACPQYDQTGARRAIGLICSIGAYEYDSAHQAKGTLMQGQSPLAGAKIAATSEVYSNTQYTLSAADGTFLISNLFAGTWTFAVQVGDWPGVIAGTQFVSDDLTGLSLSVGYWMSGQTIYNGFGIGNVSLTLTSQTSTNSFSNTTSATGNFAFINLAAGDWNLVVIHPDYQVITQAINIQKDLSNFAILLTPKGGNSNSGQQISFTIQGTPDTSYSVEYATNLIAPVLWVPYSVVRSGASGRIDLVVTNAGTIPQVYYRLKP